MVTEICVFLIFLAVAHVALVKALFPAQFVQNGKFASPELVRSGVAMVFSLTEPIKNRKSKIENLKRRLLSTRADEAPVPASCRINCRTGRVAWLVQTPKLVNIRIGLRLQLRGSSAIRKRFDDWYRRFQSRKAGIKPSLQVHIAYCTYLSGYYANLNRESLRRNNLIKKKRYEKY